MEKIISLLECCMKLQIPLAVRNKLLFWLGQRRNYQMCIQSVIVKKLENVFGK
jgi:hypothetical protein